MALAVLGETAVPYTERVVFGGGTRLDAPGRKAVTPVRFLSVNRLPVRIVAPAEVAPSITINRSETTGTKIRIVGDRCIARLPVGVSAPDPAPAAA